MRDSVIGNAVGLGNFKYGAKTIVDINSQKVFEGVCFSWSRRFVLPSSGDVPIVVDPTGISGEKSSVVLPTKFVAVGGGPIFIDLYFGTDSDEDGTLWAGGNRDNNLTTAPETTVRFDPTINDYGTKTPFETMIPSNGVSAVASFGGQSLESLIFRARTDGKYTFRVLNQEATAVNCLFAMTVFEV